MAIKKSPHHLSGMQPTHQQQQQPQQQGLMGNPMAPHMTQQQHMQQQVSQQQYMQQIPQQQVQQVQVQQQQIMHMSPPRGDPLSSPPPVAGPQSSHVQRPPPSNVCMRHGCPNPPIVNSEWEDEYCSNECVASHCRDVFTGWVASNQNSQPNFSTVK
ncbi:Similar to TOX4: TOX high mobility group box family member 4 (Pongo abelii) [Cotesia congregata]|uniref:Similar to TOX4: TOX high mobility group box family member 4 (Pongo abelii) n=1 Tax=Cotesia congregata TaxID=51543 RepID=A0A8J2MV00_COTCN|nr:Similar to TOX4: TOX high mobility group box family member 4 (Pongo abelii) [Cotesia congregata]